MTKAKPAQLNMIVLPNTKGCFVCGSQNPIGMHQKFHTDGNEVHTHFHPVKEHSGFSTVVHGGIIATLLDEIMVWAIAVKTSSFAYCAELSVRYLKPVSPNRSYVAKARLDENKRNRLFISSSELVDEQGVVYSTSTGKYIPIPWNEAIKMFDDFEGDPAEIKTTMEKIRTGTLVSN